MRRIFGMVIPQITAIRRMFRVRKRLRIGLNMKSYQYFLLLGCSLPLLQTLWTAEKLRVRFGRDTLTGYQAPRISDGGYSFATSSMLSSAFRSISLLYGSIPASVGC